LTENQEAKIEMSKAIFKGALMQVPILDLKAQYATIKDEVMRAISKVCESQSFALGPAVVEFEEKIAEYCGSKYAIGVSSGTDALLASLMALEIKAGDEVITTPFTFFSTAGSIIRVGAKPVFVDVDANSYNIDPSGFKCRISFSCFGFRTGKGRYLKRGLEKQARRRPLSHSRTLANTR